MFGTRLVEKRGIVSVSGLFSATEREGEILTCQLRLGTKPAGLKIHDLSGT